jgi:hypothetical protein
MIYPGTPHDIVALPGKVHGGFREVYPEVAFNENYHGGPLVVGGPLMPLLPGRVNAPFNFHILAGANAFCWVDEVAEYPSAPGLTVFGGIPAVPVGAQRRTPRSIAGWASVLPMPVRPDSSSSNLSQQRSGAPRVVA